MPSITVWKCASRQAIGGDHRPQRERHRMLRRAGEHGADLLPPPGELRARELRVGDLVDDVVDLAAERVERGDRAPPLRRQEQEAVVEARAALRRLCWQYSSGVMRRLRDGRGDAGAEGRRASRATRAQSVRESFGRRRKTSPPAASMPSRMRWPPASTPDNLEAEPPRQRARRAAVRIRASRARATIRTPSARATRRRSARRRCAPR